MATTHAERPAGNDAVRTPSVIVVLVARDAEAWLRGSLQSLAHQTHGRLGVVAVDNASSDRTREVLEQALGERRVIHLEENRRLAGAMRAAVELPAARAADYLLLLHDDTALEPDAVLRMVEAAEGIGGTERVGVVGPKVVDWEDPRLLREVGRSTDGFGHPFTPLQDDELDQGQYDRVLEVLFVSSCAMLISQDAWRRTGEFDERYGGRHDDLDFCWRARLAGFRVLMTPLAVARHRGASARGERRPEHRRRSSRYYAERAGLASMLKDYGLLTLLWLLPIYTVLGLARLVYLALARRFEDAFDLLAAWGWNLLHLPGTVRRRVRAQSVRSVRDGAVRRFMASTVRLPRWFERAEEFLDEGFDASLDEEEAPRQQLSRRAATVAIGHPVLVASVIGVALGVFAVRHFIGPEPLGGGALAAFPGAVEDFFNELVSAVRTTILGGAQPASPSLAALGAASWLSFGSTHLAEKVVLAALPPLTAILAYRAFARQTGRPGSAVVAAATYALSAVALWTFSEGRVGLLVGFAVLPVVWDRLDGAYRSERPERPIRFSVALGLAVAIGTAFEPGLLLGVGLMVAAHVIGGRRRLRGLGLTVLGAAAAGALAFPVVADLLSDPAASTSSFVGTDDPWSLLRLAPGGGPGSWALAAFLPVAAVICFAAAPREQRGRSWRAMAVAVAGLALAWLSASGYLPDALTNAPVYVTTAAFAEAALIAYGASGIVSGLEQQAFGARQLAAAVLTLVLAVGIGAQSIQVALAEWEVRPNGLPPAWPVIDSSAPGEFRILWVGEPRGDRFPAPGGDPIGTVQSGDASVRFTVTDRHGVTALDTGRPSFGPGYELVRSALDELLAGGTSNAGAMLGPLGIRYVVAGDGDLPPATARRLDAQVDLDRVPAGGLIIFRNAAELPTAFVGADVIWPPSPEGADLAEIAERPIVPVDRIPPPDSGEAAPVGLPGEVVASDQFDSGWRVENGGERGAPHRAFGFAMAAPVEGGDVSFLYTDQWVRTIEMSVLAVLWLAALWITRKPVSA